ncbi:hypothetical protein [uncultured Desulfobacter sp.]|uniref:hypothetical protein n=1 Tax=uncultured Desulfobacter sp. TaxID=240139 RepID=UPI0029F4CEC3|nr:hypothetical protein [uncultured Desulfobacter sp.]
MNTTNKNRPQREENYSIKATFITDEKQYHRLPCKVYLPERIFEKPFFFIGPIDEKNKEIFDLFEARFRTDFGNVIGQEEPRTYLDSPIVYFSSKQIKYNNDSGSIRTMKAEPQDLHVIDNHKLTVEKNDVNHLTFWLSPNSFLTPSATRESSFSGDITYEKVNPIEFYIKNNLRLSFAKHYKSKDLENGDLIQWSYLVAETETDIPIRESDTLKTKLLPDIDDFLLLVSFATRFRTSCLGWAGYDDSCTTTFYRGNYVFPNNEKQDWNRGILDITRFNDFIEKCYPIFLRHSNKHLLRSALHSIVPVKSYTLEASFLRLFAGLETLILSFRRENDLEYIVPVDEEWTELRKLLQKYIKSIDTPTLSKAQRKLIYPKLGELNRVSIREAFNRFSTEYRLKLDDLWPVFGDKASVGLVDIRNKIIHGDPFSHDVFDCLMVALEHLKYTLERMILTFLEWDVDDSLINPRYLKSRDTTIKDLPGSMIKLTDFLRRDPSSPT